MLPPLRTAASDDLALLLWTSGSTGRPKIVPLTHANICHSASETARVLRLTPEDRCLNAMPLFHATGLMIGVLASVAAGAGVVCPPEFDATSFFDWWKECIPTWYTASPAMHAAIAEQFAAHAETILRHRPRFIRSSASPLTVALLEKLESQFGAPVVDFYGLTESAPLVSANPLPPGVRKPGSVGLPVGCDVGIMDDEGQLLGVGGHGQIVVRGPGVMRGYEQTADEDQPFIGGWLCTGDTGYMDADGYLFISGRLKDTINRGGEKIAPREVEDVLLMHPSVKEAAVLGVPDLDVGEEVVAAVVLRPGADATARDLRKYVASALTLSKVPRRIVVLRALPLTPSGKLARGDLTGLLSEEAPRGILDTWDDALASIPGHCPSVFRVALAVREDSPGERRVVALVVASDGQTPDGQCLSAELARVLPSYMLPSESFLVARLPTTGEREEDGTGLPLRSISASIGTTSENEAERQLLQIWKRVLGVEALGIDDDYFDVGGHSLTAVRLVSEVEHLIGISLPISTLFQARTVRRLASLLATKGWLPDWSCLVPIRESGSLAPIFCVHGIGSYALEFAGLAKALGEDQPFFAFQSRGLDGQTQPFERIEDMAAQYIAEMRRVQPVGPFSLLGYSFGGVIAFEMAHQLKASGESVAFLGLLDSSFPGYTMVRNVPFLERILLHGRTMVHRGSLSKSAAYLWHRIVQLWTRTGHRLRPIAPVRRPVQSDSALQKVVGANKRARLAYLPQVWDGPLTMFASADSESIWGDPRGQWADVVDGKLDVVWVPGSHTRMLEPQRVSILAQAIKERLRRARAANVGVDGRDD
jgi:acyl-coenzyme A synthetase/AMP-(fatty) acid ligase/thioesterase domain-containing protein/acyl carrier protein